MKAIICTTETVEFDEPPPTDPSPGTGNALPARADGLDDDLEKRLQWLAAEVRTTSAEHAKKKRAASVLQAREYKTALVPAFTRVPTDVGLAKVEIALAVIPPRDPTLVTLVTLGTPVGRRLTENDCELDISEPEELSRTLPLDPNAPVVDPLPFHISANIRVRPRGHSWIVAVSLLGGIVVGAFLHQSLLHSWAKSAYATIPQANRTIAQAAHDAEVRYAEWEMIQLLLPVDHASNPSAADSVKVVRIVSPQSQPVKPSSSIVH